MATHDAHVARAAVRCAEPGTECRRRLVEAAFVLKLQLTIIAAETQARKAIGSEAQTLHTAQVC